MESEASILDKYKQAQKEINQLRGELLETNRGIVALYSEINDANSKLQTKNEELKKAFKEIAETQERLVQSEKMAAIGSVVVTYNHHINNPLMIILGNVQLLLLREQDLNDNVKKALSVIENECKRIADVMHRIKEYEKLLPVKYLENMYDVGQDESV